MISREFKWNRLGSQGSMVHSKIQEHAERRLKKQYHGQWMGTCKNSNQDRPLTDQKLICGMFLIIQITEVSIKLLVQFVTPQTVGANDPLKLIKFVCKSQSDISDSTCRIKERQFVRVLKHILTRCNQHKHSGNRRITNSIQQFAYAFCGSICVFRLKRKGKGQCEMWKH